MIARSPIPRRRSKPRRVRVVRDRTYLDFLKSEGRCGVCTFHGYPKTEVVIRYGLWKIIDPAHFVPNGLSSKGADDQAIPLCRAHHDEQTRLGWPNFCLKYGFDREHEVKVWNSLYLIWKEHKTWPQPTK